MSTATAEKTTEQTPITGRLTATVAAGDLAAALRNALRFVNLRRPPVPVLGGVILSGARGVLTVTGFDYETSYRQDIAAPGARGGADGAVLVEAARLLDRLAVFGRRDDLTLKVEDGALLIYGPNVRYRMPLMTLEDYPTLPEVKGHSITLSEADRANLLRVTTTAGTDGYLPILTALSLTAKARGRVEVAATDRYRLSKAVLAAKASKNLSVLVPAPLLVKALSMLSRIPGPVTLHVADKDGVGGHQWVSLRTGAHQINARTVDGEYPKVSAIFPTDQAPCTIEADADTLIDSVRKAAVGVPRNCPLVINVDTKTRAVTITAGSPDEGYDLLVDVPGAKVKGKPTTMGGGLALNPQFLLSGLRTFAGQKVRLEVRMTVKPVVLASDEAPDYQHILMPVRLAG